MASSFVRVVMVAVICGAGAGLLAGVLTVNGLAAYAQHLGSFGETWREWRSADHPITDSTPTKQHTLLVTPELFRAIHPIIETKWKQFDDTTPVLASATALTSDGWFVVVQNIGDAPLVIGQQIVLSDRLMKIQNIAPSGIAFVTFVKIDANGLSVIPFAKNSTVLLGEAVWMLRAPERVLPTSVHSVHHRIKRRIEDDSIQIMLNIPPPTPSGVVVNANGEMIGLWSAGGEEMILLEDLLMRFSSLVREGAVSAPWSGVTVEIPAHRIGSAPEHADRWTVVEVAPKSPGALSGLKPGMEIVRINNVSVDRVVSAPREWRAGSEMTLLVAVEGSEALQEISFTLAKQL